GHGDDRVRLVHRHRRVVLRESAVLVDDAGVDGLVAGGEAAEAVRRAGRAAAGVADPHRATSGANRRLGGQSGGARQGRPNRQAQTFGGFFFSLTVSLNEVVGSIRALIFMTRSAPRISVSLPQVIVVHSIG